MTPVVTCPSCKLVQFQLKASSNSYPEAAVCRRCRAPLGFSVIEIPLDQLNPRSPTTSGVSLGSVLRTVRRRRGASQLNISRLSQTDRKSGVEGKSVDL